MNKKYREKKMVGLMLSLLFFTYALAQKNVQNNLRELRIDPEAQLSAIPVSEHFLVNYQPFESDKESLFGWITQMEISKNRIVVLNHGYRRTNKGNWSAILIFDRQGRFINKMMLQRVNRFAMDYEREEISFFNMYEHTWYFYDNKGKLLRKHRLERRNLPEYASLSNREFVFFRTYTNTSGSYELLQDTTKGLMPAIAVAAEDLEVKRSFLPFDTTVMDDSMLGIEKNYFQSGQQAVISIPYNSMLFAFDGNNLVPTYRFMLPLKNTLPADFMQNKIYRNKRQDYLKAHPDRVYAADKCYLAGKYFTFKLINSHVGSLLRNFIYDERNNTYFRLQDLQPDEGNHFLPLNDDMLASDGESLIGIITAKTLIDHVEKMQAAGEKVILPATLQAIMKNADKPQNAILVKLTPKP